MRKKVFIAIIITILLFTVGCDNMKYDNSTDKNILITESHSSAQISDLKKKVESRSITFSKFKRKFNVQCLRKTHQGYYAILKSDDGRNVFVFIDNDYVLCDIIVADKFLTKDEFRDSVQLQMTRTEVLNIDPNTRLLPISSVSASVHYVQEGIYLVTYSRLVNNEFIMPPTVSSIEFISNEEHEKNEYASIPYITPFILEVDKKN